MLLELRVSLSGWSVTISLKMCDSGGRTKLRPRHGGAMADRGVFALELAVKLQEAGLPEGCLHDDLGIGLVVLSAPAEACCSSQ
eukprot:gene32572-41379_t